MKLIDVLVIALIGFIGYLAIQSYRKNGSCGCHRKKCCNKNKR